jgi:hypothetical protein
MTKMLAVLTLIFTVISCSSKRTYKYVETVLPPNSGVTFQDKEPEIINASSDSEAYIHAYTNFCIAKSVNDQTEKTSGVALTRPVSFKLINDKGMDIRFAINFEKKDSIEKSIEAKINARVDDVYNTTNKKGNIAEKLDTSTYEILATDDKPAAENYYVFLKNKNLDKSYLQNFVDKFRQEFCSKKCNIFLYDTKSIKPLVTIYPLADKDYLKVADHFIAQSTFDMTEVWMYPFQDIKYKELGGKNWKKKPIE